MSKYTLEVSLTDEQVSVLEQEIKSQNEWEKANGYDGTWTVERELLNIIRDHVRKMELSGGTSREEDS